MTTQEISLAIELVKFAESDIRIAQKKGVMAICQTKIGNVELVFDGTFFQAFNFNNTAIEHTGKMVKKDMVIWLASIYEVL